MDDPYFLDFSTRDRHRAPVTETVDALTNLAASMADAVQGLRKTAHDAPPRLRAEAELLLALHERHCIELHEAFDRVPYGNGELSTLTLSQAVREAVADRQGFFDEIYADTARHVAEGERHIVSLYGTAIERTRDLNGISGLLQHQRDVLIAHFKARRSAR